MERVRSGSFNATWINSVFSDMFYKWCLNNRCLNYFACHAECFFFLFSKTDQFKLSFFSRETSSNQWFYYVHFFYHWFFNSRQYAVRGSCCFFNYIQLNRFPKCYGLWPIIWPRKKKCIHIEIANHDLVNHCLNYAIQLERNENNDWNFMANTIYSRHHFISYCRILYTFVK